MVPLFIGLGFGLPANKHGIGYLGQVQRTDSVSSLKEKES